ncbi:F0F1 ATP synthase subunit delta [Tropicimonas sp. IMCC34043]|uniref:F0F1 ATP synthase subunit delta n=1 Tax=Tropicimonas sp. IMCC34043 TaxID=2248760 RepID=UPI000E22EAD7|nr:F0F1 ATP synthase subunit delta [Tropicimonas sp. IMCC34043]
MTIDFWGLGLQAVNVLILVWLLSRVFWRPVAGAIARRQETTQAMLAAAKAAEVKAGAALAEVGKARDGIAAERRALLAEAAAKAEAAAQASLAEARAKAETLLADAQTAIDRDRAAARRETAAEASALSVDIAARLLGQLNGPAVQTAFLARLLKAIAGMSAAERASLVASAAEIEIVTAAALTDAEWAEIGTAISAALGGAPRLTFATDPDLIAGLELRSAHFVLRNSWQADLAAILKEMKDAA